MKGVPSMSKKPPGLEKFTHAQILKFGEMLQQGQMPPELAGMVGGVDADGKPVVDSEGGCIIQPHKGFVVKTKAAAVGKVFINMCKHELVEPFEQKPITKEEQAKYGTGEVGFRFPLSMGEKREEHDKKGEPAMVIDVIWAPATVDKALSDAQFRQQVIELAITYVNQKYGIVLDERFTIPKLKYKGATVQYQRIKVKKSAKI